MFTIYRRYFLLLFLTLFFLCHPAFAVDTFEDEGVVDKVLSAENIVIVNETKFFLSHSVYNTGGNNKKPAIDLLEEGITIGFSGIRSKPYNRITSITIYSQPEE